MPESDNLPLTFMYSCCHGISFRSCSKIQSDSSIKELLKITLNINTKKGSRKDLPRGSEELLYFVVNTVKESNFLFSS